MSKRKRAITSVASTAPPAKSYFHPLSLQSKPRLIYYLVLSIALGSSLVHMVNLVATASPSLRKRSVQHATFWCTTPIHKDGDSLVFCPPNQVCVGVGCSTINTSHTSAIENAPSFDLATCPECCCTAKTGKELLNVQSTHANCFVGDLDSAKASKKPLSVQSGVPLRVMSPRAASALHDMYVLVDAIATELGPATASQYHFKSGSLIGMVRHHGLIPWDHDGDVCFPQHAIDVLMDELCSDNSHEQYCFDKKHTSTQGWYNSTIHRAIVRSASTVRNRLHPTNVCVLCRQPEEPNFPLYMWLSGMRMDIFTKDGGRGECDLRKFGGGGVPIRYPFYNLTLPGRKNAASYLTKVQYNDQVMDNFVCSEGNTGDAHGVSPPIKLTDFSPAVLDWD